VEFLKQSEDDPTAGSTALRRAVIAEAVAETEPLDFHQAVRSRPVWTAASIAGVILLGVLLIVLVDRSSARIAAARLTNPFGNVAWPQVHHLVVRNPIQRIARSQPFEVLIADRYGARLPAEVRLHYRFENADGSTTEETQPMRFTGSMMVARRESVTRSFSYRAEGGDDDSMPWFDVEVLDPPALHSITATLTPPAYTGWPNEAVENPIRALVGTQVELAAQSTKPLESARLFLDDTRVLDGQITEDGLKAKFPGSGSSPWVLEKSGAYWFGLKDLDGLPGGEDERWLVRAVPDSPPAVSIEDPTANLFVTPQATVPLRVSASDDLAVWRMDLLFARSDDLNEPENTFELYAGPDQVEPRTVGFAAATDSGERQTVNYTWSLASLGLAPGDRVTFSASAADYRPQSSRSEPRRLIVITSEELTDRIAARQSFILAELTRALEIQRQSRGQVSKLEIRLEETRHFDQLDVDHLRGAELSQRQVKRTLTSGSEGVPMHVRGLLADLENNKVDSPDMRRRMEWLLEEIGRLDREHLTVIGHELTAAIKAAQIRLDDRPPEPPSAEDNPDKSQAGEPDAAVMGRLADAGKQQDAVILALEEIVGQLAQWANSRRFFRDIGQLLRRQDELADRTAELARSTLGRERENLSSQEVARLRTTARDQFELARRLDRTLQDMSESADQLVETDPLGAEKVSDAVHRAGELATSAKMQSAGSSLEGNQMGQAIGLQNEIRENLKELLDLLAGRNETELERLVERLRQAEEDLADLARRQSKLAEELERVGQDTDQETRSQMERLRREQESLEQETDRMTRRLERLMAQQASRTTEQAAGSMQAAAQGAGAGDAQGASREAAEAKSKLDEAQQQVARRRRQLEAELAMEQLARLEDSLKTLRGRQQSVIDETRRLDELATTQGELTRGQLASLLNVGREQQLVRGETIQLSEKLAGAAVFNLALGVAADDMKAAANLLERKQTGEETQRAELNARARLDQLIEAVKEEEPESGDGGGAGGAGNQPGGMPMAQALQALAELKLLKLMQEELNLRTRDLENAFGQVEDPADDARGQYDALSSDQGQLADLMLNLIAPQEDPDTDLDTLPEVPVQND
jgi:hypothetical protein